jgi:hypothetical protein
MQAAYKDETVSRILKILFNGGINAAVQSF